MRIDVYLHKHGYTGSRTAARGALAEERVRVDGRIIKKPSYQLDEDAPHCITIENAGRCVGRGGIKLEGALDFFGINAGGLTALDIGASTGGFTECLLRRGAALVYAIDVGHGQLHDSLRGDSRVVVMENRNARDLQIRDFVCGENASRDCAESASPGRGIAGIVVIDVSFISQTLIIPKISAFLVPGGLFVSLIKPQFESGRESVGKGGIVRSNAARAAAIIRVTECCAEFGLGFAGLMRSVIDGGGSRGGNCSGNRNGNREYFALFKKGADGGQPSDEVIRNIL